MKFFERWPTPSDLLESKVEDVGALMQPIGLHMRRASNIRRFTGKVDESVKFIIGFYCHSELLLCLPWQPGQVVSSLLAEQWVLRSTENTCILCQLLGIALVFKKNAEKSDLKNDP
jgi:hypothetical protein